MSLAEFRSKGRLGCPKDYEVFRAHLDPLLLRVHNASAHRGRLPGMDEGTRQRLQQLSDLRAKLEAAIREEAYESAARLRDEIQELEAQPRAP
jgi:protein arginine kinase activator